MMKNASLANKISSSICFAIVIIGTIGNFFLFLICLKKKFRENPTFVFYLFMLIMDIVCQYLWNLSHFLETFYGFVIDELSPEWCKIGTFYQFVSLQTSAWLLVRKTLKFFVILKIIKF